MYTDRRFYILLQKCFPLSAACPAALRGGSDGPKAGSSGCKEDTYQRLMHKEAPCQLQSLNRLGSLVLKGPGTSFAG